MSTNQSKLFAWSVIAQDWIEITLIAGSVEQHRKLLRKQGRCTKVVRCL